MRHLRSIQLFIKFCKSNDAPQAPGYALQTSRSGKEKPMAKTTRFDALALDQMVKAAYRSMTSQ